MEANAKVAGVVPVVESMVALVIADHLLRQQMTKKADSIQRIREEIDFIDDMMMTLLSQRQDLVRDVGRWKKENRVGIANPKREREIIKKRLLLADEAGLDPEFIKKIYSAVFEHARSIQLEV